MIYDQICAVIWHDYFILASLSDVKGATLQSPKKPLATFPCIREYCFHVDKVWMRIVWSHLIGAFWVSLPHTILQTHLQLLGNWSNQLEIKHIPICQSSSHLSWPLCFKPSSVEVISRNKSANGISHLSGEKNIFKDNWSPGLCLSQDIHSLQSQQSISA